MHEHTVKPGEGIAKIALSYGLLPDTVWNHAKNSALKERRKNPEILMPGDIVHIPDKQVKQVEAALDRRHRFQKKGVSAEFQLRIMNGSAPRAGEPYLIEIDNERTISGQTDADGWIRTFLTPRAQSGKLILQGGAEVYLLQFGHVDPIDTVSGAKSRLRNLGFYDGPVDGRASDELTAAVKAFQLHSGITQSGQMDKQTQAALEDAHGS